MRSFFFVVFSYVSKAAVKIGRKLEEEEEEEETAVGAAWDMVLVEKVASKVTHSSRTC